MLVLLQIILALFGVILMLALAAIIWLVLVVAKFALVNVVYLAICGFGLLVVWKTIFGPNGLLHALSSGD